MQTSSAAERHHDAPTPISPLVARPWLAAAPPAPATSLVGREREVESVRALLRDDGVRLVTLTGPGGVGKTRLALQVATTLADDFADGAAFVSLAAVTDPEAVAPAIGRALGIQVQGDQRPGDRLVAALRDADLLLVLDNLEQVAAVAPDLAAWLAACPMLTMLATSRVRLRLAGERVFPVPSLTLPDVAGGSAPDQVAAAEAGRLFLARARAVAPSFALTTATAPLVAEICRRVDGVPLAIELAAARVGHLPLSTLRDRLDRDLSLLSGGPVDAAPHHRTMRDAIGWSYDLLAPVEQSLFRRLSVFAGGFTLESAEAVAGGQDERSSLSPCPAVPLSPFDLLASLVEKNLVRFEPGIPVTSRYQILETIREFGAERLVAEGEADEARSAHAHYFLHLAERQQLRRHELYDETVLDMLDAERANFVCALTRFEERRDAEDLIRLAAALGWYWWVRGYLHEGRHWLVRAWALRDAASPVVRARVAATLGSVSLAGSDLDMAAVVFEQGLALCRDLGDAPGEAQMLHGLGAIESFRGEDARAVALLHDALARARSLSDARLSALVAGAVLGELGDAFRGLGDLNRAEACHQEALHLQRGAGSASGEMHSLYDLGADTSARGDSRRARECFRESLRLARRFGRQRVMLIAIEGIAAVLTDLGQVRQATRFFGAAARGREMTGVTDRTPTDRASYERSLAACRVALGEDAFAAAWATGAVLPLAAAVADALDEIADRETPPAILLTPREQEVLRLLAAGKTDREIAEILFIGERTAESHVARVFAKLGVRNRAAAIAAARSAGLV